MSMGVPSSSNRGANLHRDAATGGKQASKHQPEISEPQLVQNDAVQNTVAICIDELEYIPPPSAHSNRPKMVKVLHTFLWLL